MKRRPELEARVEAKQGGPLEEERKRNTSPEQKERARKNAQEKRRQAEDDNFRKVAKILGKGGD
jgi:hypothetical protein